MWNVVKRIFLVLAVLCLFWALSLADASWDSERLDLEMRMQQRVEEALGKILPPGLFVVVVRIDPIPQAPAAPEAKAAPRSDDAGYYLPGVPVRKNFDSSGEEMKDLVQSLKPDPQIFHRFIRRIMVTLVVDKDIPQDVVNKVRDLTRQLIGLDPARGDTLDIQRTAFNKPVQPVFEATTLTRIQSDLKSNWLLISLMLVIFSIAVFFLFMFGPLRGFLNNFVQVLPTLKPIEGARMMGGRDMQMLPPFFMPPMGLPAPGAASPAAFSGSLQVENPNKTTLPFGFIREDHLGNLAILLAREAPEKAAVVLGYLPAEWISRVLARLDQGMQSAIAANLATTRQLLPEQVEDIEQDLKRRLDYLIGGPDRIIAVYESLDPDAQRRMLESLRESRPEIAEDLRQRTLLFEDLDRLPSNGLKTLLREVDIQTLVMALRGAADAFRTRVLEHVSEGKAEIIRQELDLGEGPAGRATMEAQKKIVAVAKRLEKEGQLAIPQLEDPVPTARYGASLRSTLKLPPGLRNAESETTDAPEPDASSKENIQDRIKRFLNRKTDRERYAADDTDPHLPPTGTGE